MEDTILFAGQVNANTTEKFRKKARYDGRTKKAVVRFYPGQQLALKIEIYVKRKGNDARYSLIRYSPEGNNQLAGDDDRFTISTEVEFEKNDEFIIVAENTDATYNYDAFVLLNIEYGGR